MKHSKVIFILFTAIRNISEKWKWHKHWRRLHCVQFWRHGLFTMKTQNILWILGFILFSALATAVCDTPNNNSIFLIANSNGICAGTYMNVSLKMNASNYNIDCNDATFMQTGNSGVLPWDDNTKSTEHLSNCHFYNYTYPSIDIYNKWVLENVTLSNYGNITIWSNVTIKSSVITFNQVKDKDTKIAYSSYVAGQAYDFKILDSVIKNNNTNFGYTIQVTDRSANNRLTIDNTNISNLGNGTDDSVRICEANTICSITNSHFDNCRGLSLNGFSDGTYYRANSLINISGNTFTNCFEPIKLTRYNNASNSHTLTILNNIINCSLSGRNINHGTDPTHDCVGINMDDVANVLVDNNTVYQYDEGYALDAGSSTQDGTTAAINVTFSNNKVYGMDATHKYYYNAIAINQSYNNKIINNLYQGYLCNLSVISVGDAYNTTVLNNIVNITSISPYCQSSGYGINFYNLYGTSYYGVNVSNNYVAGVNAGIRIGSADTTKSMNYFQNITLENIIKYDFFALTEGTANNSQIEYYRNGNRISFLSNGVYIINGTNSDVNILSISNAANISVYVNNSTIKTYESTYTNLARFNLFDITAPYNDVKNVSNNLILASNVNNFSIALTAGQAIIVGDFVAPTISAVVVTALNSSAIQVNWTTDMITNSSVNYGTTTALGTIYGVNDAVTSHSVTINGLSQGTLYYVNVTSYKTNSSNFDSDGIYNATTNSTITISNVTIQNVTSASVMINWTTSAAGNSSINYGLNLSLGTVSSNSSYVVNHSLTLTGLMQNKTYFYNITSTLNGSASTVYAGNFTTLAISVENVSINPSSNVYHSTDLFCNGTVINGDASNSSWNWYVLKDGQANYILQSGQNLQTLNASLNLFASGDYVKCEYIPSDGFNNGTSINSSNVSIVNAPSNPGDGVTTPPSGGGGSTVTPPTTQNNSVIDLTSMCQFSASPASISFSIDHLSEKVHIYNNGKAFNVSIKAVEIEGFQDVSYNIDYPAFIEVSDYENVTFDVKYSSGLFGLKPLQGKNLLVMEISDCANDVEIPVDVNINMSTGIYAVNVTAAKDSVWNYLDSSIMPSINENIKAYFAFLAWGLIIGLMMISSMIEALKAGKGFRFIGYIFLWIIITGIAGVLTILLLRALL